MIVLRQRFLPYIVGVFFLFILGSISCVYLYFVHNQLKEHLKLDAKEAILFVKLRFISYEELLSVLKNSPPYLLDPAWMIDELQSHPLLAGVVIWDKKDILLNSFPLSKLPPKNIVEVSKNGIEKDGLFYLSDDFYLKKGEKINILVAIHTDFKNRVWRESIVGSLVIFLCCLIIVALFGYFLKRGIEREDKLRKRLLDNEKLVAAGKLSAMLAHEIKNPLNTLGMGLQVIKEQVSMGKCVLEKDVEKENELVFSGKETACVIDVSMIDVLLEQVKKLNLLVEESLVLAKGIKPSLEEIEWNIFSEKIKKSTFPFFTSKHVDLRIEKNDISFRADKKWLERALVNLVKNSIEEVPEKDGKVELKVERVGDRVYFIVTDNGPGIKKEEIDDLFRPFYTTKVSGFGVGLYLVKEVAKAHGGDVTLKNLPHGGLEVSFFINGNL